MKRVIAVLLCMTMLLSLMGCGAAGASDKKWVIATETYFKPFEYTNENNEFVGIDVDIIAAIAKDQGFSYDLVPLGWDAGVTACKTGQADAVLAAASITEERTEDGWLFSDGYYDSCLVFAVSEDSSISSLSDLKDLNVAVKKGTISEDYALSLSDQYGFNVSVFDDTPSVYQDVLYGDSAACIDDEPVLTAAIKDGMTLSLLNEGQSDPSQYALAVLSKSNKKLIKMFNEGLANIKADGTYQQILDKYLK